MTPCRAPRRFFRVRLFAALLALAAAAPPAEALAQDFFSDLFGGLFGGGGGGGGGGHRRRPSYDRPAREPRYEREPRHVRRLAPHAQPQRRSVARPSSGQRDAPRRVEKSQSEVAFHVAVLGDAFSQLLAEGLDETFAENPKIGVFRKGKDNSGLVRSDYFDWLKSAREIAAGEPKPDVAVVMIGGNDRQALGEESRALEPLSPRWREIYEGRVDSLIQILKEKNIPVIWVGLPIMQPTAYSAAIAEINGIFRTSAAKAGVPFVDLWDKFTDERGQYAAFGPDVKGQIVKLRSSDGIHFTRDGARKLAHFVEGEIRRVYDARETAAPAAPPTPQPDAGTAAAPTPAPAAPAQPVVFQPPAETAPRAAAPPILPAERPAIGAPQPLNAAVAAPSDELARRSGAKDARDKTAPIEKAVAAHVFFEGGDQPARPGRADDFTMRPAAPPAQTIPQ